MYKVKLEEERKDVVLSKREKKAAHISNDVEKMKQVNQMNKSIETMDCDFVDYMILVERNNNLALVRKVMN